MTPSDAYFEMALKVIGIAKNPSDLRSWWVAEKRHRAEYGLSQDQIDRLIKKCSDHVSLLEEGRSEEDEKPKSSRGSYRRRRPAI